MYRPVLVLLSMVTALAVVPGSGEHGNLAVLAAAIAVLLATTAVTRGRDRLVLIGAVSRVAHRQARERGRRGAFRRQYRPDEQGRPQPRAPGNALLPA